MKDAADTVANDEEFSAGFVNESGASGLQPAGGPSAERSVADAA